MRCCVPGCSNDSRQISKSQGVTFHVFPMDNNLRLSWLRAIGKEDWKPKDRSTVCSEHFLEEDLYTTKTGLRKVRAGAVPLVQGVQICDYGEPSMLKVCRICLVTEGKFYSMRKYKLEEAFKNLTGLSLLEEDKLPQSVCCECAHRLLSSSRLRRKCHRANSLLLDVIGREECLSLLNVSSIDRTTSQLVSDLTIKINEQNHYDFYIEYQEPVLIQQEEIGIKNESVFVNDFKDIKEESSDSDRLFVASDKDYSSDDSLPLVTRKKEKTGVTKKTGKKRRSAPKPVETEPNEPKVDRRRKPFLNGDLNETLFTITDLTYEEQIAEIEKRQESANYKNSSFKCTECFKGFLEEDAYNTHIGRHTEQCGEHRCEVCKTHFRNQHALRKHTTAHHTQRFSCNQCAYVTTHRQTARLHERWHKGTKYQCPHCPDEFVKFTTYMGHIRIKHPSDFVCQLCGYSFVSEKGIELHKKLKHRSESSEIPDDGPNCDLCNVRFVSTQAHRRHLSVSARHNGTDKTGKEANKPKKNRRTKDMLERDGMDLDKDGDDPDRRFASQLRKAEGPIPCEQCGMQLEDSRAYHGHFRRVHPDKNRTNYPSMKTPSMCEVCGRMFQSYALLKDHTWTHTGERPFKCESCGKSFRMKQRLVAHRRVHSQEKATYVCSMCGKHFSTHSNRQRHMFIHTGLKPYKCEMCGKSFKHVSEKRAHITYVHLKKPWPKRARGKRRCDGRQSPLGNSMAQDMDMAQPIWPPCDPKMSEINNIIDDKPMYYNLKI